jgi:hypothetical protein
VKCSTDLRVNFSCCSKPFNLPQKRFELLEFDTPLDVVKTMEIHRLILQYLSSSIIGLLDFAQHVTVPN